MSIDFDSVHAHLAVFDMPRALDFYCGVLGFGVANSAGEPPDCDWLMLRYGTVELMLNTQYDREERPAQADAARAGAHQDTTLYFCCASPDSVYEHLRKCGVASVQPPNDSWYGMRQVYVNDPDRYLLCFQCPSSTLPQARAAEVGSLGG
ncbi:MAG TPA: VOC family protein [Gemmatimonadaceae bacterium]|jgi:catechol 2,3-dioxygenase-like lactoylglutathione lyase family enzyme|nr:VOC family protein [Gemmatimonadaceae bacterium]